MKRSDLWQKYQWCLILSIKENYKDKFTTIFYIAIYFSFILPYFRVKNTLDRPWIHIPCFQKITIPLKLPHKNTDPDRSAEMKAGIICISSLNR